CLWTTPWGHRRTISARVLRGARSVPPCTTLALPKWRACLAPRACAPTQNISTRPYKRRSRPGSRQSSKSLSPPGHHRSRFNRVQTKDGRMTTLTTRLMLFTLLCCVTASGCGRPPPQQRNITEKRVVQIDFARLIPELFAVSPDSQHVAYGARAEQTQVVIVDGQAEKPYQTILGGTLR